MARQREEDLTGYLEVLRQWVPTAYLAGLPDQPLFAQRVDGIIEFEGIDVRYLVEHKKHLRHQDIGVIVDQLHRLRPTDDDNQTKLLLVAPQIRREQGDVLQRAKIDYLDLAGNAHLNVAGAFVHVEGRRGPEPIGQAPGRPHRAWIKTVMALLVNGDLVDAPFRLLAQRADVALGTVGGCIEDLKLRGLLADTKGHRRITDLTALTALWVQAYTEVLRPKLRERRFQLRAATKADVRQRLEKVLNPLAVDWAITGADVAEMQTHYFRADETEIYAPLATFENKDVLKALIAQPANVGNLLVIEPPGPMAVQFPVGNQTPAAPPLLVYAELKYRGTDQAQEAAEIFLPTVMANATN